MNVAGIDLSSRAVDIVLIDADTGQPTWYQFPLNGQDAFDRARCVTSVMPGRSFWDETLAAGIEDPRGYGAGSIYRVQGAILASLPTGLLVQPWIPSAWRKAVSLPGNASKGHVRTHAIGSELDRVKYMGDRGYLYPAWFDEWATKLTQDQADAYCIALATKQALEREAA